MGTYLGGIDSASSAHLLHSLQLAMRSGCNLFDTARNYRHTQSERDIGAALVAIIGDEESDFGRDEFVLCSKGGYLLPEDLAAAEPYADQIVNGEHCLAPAFLAHQIAHSRAHLGVETIDIYYLQNPEVQLEFVVRTEFADRIRAAFLQLEREVEDGHIQHYGVATWDGLRVPPNHARHLSLANLVRIAQEVGGADHHFRALQFPYNMGMVEALVQPNQRLDPHADPVPLLDAAAALELLVVGSMGLMQGQLVNHAALTLPDFVTESVAKSPNSNSLNSNAQIALHFNRSTPSLHVTLAGMNSYLHAQENLYLATIAPWDEQDFARLLSE